MDDGHSFQLIVEALGVVTIICRQPFVSTIREIG